MSDREEAGGEASPKFRRRKEARPDELLDAALDLFTEQGFDRTTVEQIARRAGVSKGALYLYFPSKDAVIEALVDRAVGPVVGEVVIQIERFEGDPRVLLKRFVPLFAARLSDPRIVAVPKLVVREAVSHPRLAEMYRERVIGRVLPALATLFRQGVAGGHIRPVDPEMAVRSLLGPVLMHVLLADVFGIRAEGVTPGDIGLARLFDTHLTIFCAGLDPAPVQEAPHG
ncbi:TetR family transcriptional regulator [Celeribacter ethanolicus]|uniref:TetR family transcriptional regulator n=1 Tax=Celeribacter ethanolicus TaxID=1758178 RepID=A0A291G7C8_9RHOB|nr:TetR/AcrR family transcriptional regulator [Celeribacter ethanolicus]ATG46253.1 TetR family transcriptional regulator [Celeribacter ethanolicus]TNE68805.1 MAG: TetR/AcrR family transcriptional regulator [Paracoccaceae bacterium]